MAFLRRLADGIEEFLDYVTLLFFVVITVSIIVQVFARYIFHNPLPWPEEVARYLMCGLTMLGSASVIRREGHINVTLVTDRLSGLPLYVVNLISDVLVFTMAGYLTWYGYGLMVIGHRQVSAGAEIPMSLPYAAIPLGGFFIAVMILLNRIAPRQKPGQEGSR